MVNSLTWYFVHLQSATKFAYPCCRIRATKCVQRTIALYQYKLFNLFPFSVIEFFKVVMFKPWTQCVIEIRDSFFFLRRGQSPLRLWLRTLQCEWILNAKESVYLVFAIDRNTLRFSLHLAESVVREIQKTKRCVIVLFLSSSCSESQT